MEDARGINNATIISTTFFVEHGHFYFVNLGQDEFELADTADRRPSFQAQRNGLCGAASRPSLYLYTGTSYGPINIAIEFYSQEPQTSAEWQDLVQVSFELSSNVSSLCNLRENMLQISIPSGQYRVRYGISEMGTAAQVGTVKKPIESCLLQFWPGEAQDDEIVRVGSELAKYLHGRVSN